MTKSLNALTIKGGEFMSELTNLLGVYTDKVSQVYDDFIYEFEGKGIQWAWMMRPEFLGVPEDKRVFPFAFAIPHLTHTRVNLIKSDAEIAQMMAELKQKYETMPEFQGRELPTMPSMRDVMDQYFMVFIDDEVEFKISYHHYTLVHQTGKLGELKFDLYDLTRAKVRIMPGDLMTVTIKLITKGQQRRQYEANSYIEEADTFAEEKLQPLLLKKLAELSPEKKQERMNLFPDTKIEDVKISQLPTDDVVVLEEMIHALGNEDLTNEQVLSQVNCMRVVSLEKMKDWLNRPFGGGTEEDFR